jgi:delta(3,5)-delta(2,4)-dienoyl-CoA isomerase
MLTGGVPDGTRCSLALLRDIKEFQQAIGAPERCPFSVIVVVHGHVLGLGVDIVSACDIRYAVERTQVNIKVRHYFPHFSSNIYAIAQRMPT